MFAGRNARVVKLLSSIPVLRNCVVLVLLLNRAVNLNPKNIEYQLNLAIIYEQQKDYRNALHLYTNVIKNYVTSDSISQSIPIAAVKKRTKFIKNIKNTNS